MTAPHPGLIVAPEFDLTVQPPVTARPLTMPCPDCGADALWQWSMPMDRNGTFYPGVECPKCDAP
jgi:ssDNA-binding Zn-finger/Zn-ribbon topoisomerase 1